MHNGNNLGLPGVTTSAASCSSKEKQIKGKADRDQFADMCARYGAIAKKADVKGSDRDPRAIPVRAIRSWLH